MTNIYNFDIIFYSLIMVVKNQNEQIDIIIKIIHEKDAYSALQYMSDNLTNDNRDDSYVTNLSEQVAYKLQKNNDFENSILFYDSILKIDSGNEDILIEKGICLISLEKYNESLEIFKKIYSGNKQNIKVVLGLGSSLFYQGKFDKAMPYLEDAIKLAPNFYPIRELAGITYHHLGMKNKAVKNMIIAEGVIEFTDNNKNFTIFDNIK